MKLFRHYKNKNYKYIGEAKHSETLEDMVIYETLYENSLGTLWTRPKKMFFESIELGGIATPRFKKINLDIKETNQVTETEIQEIALIMEKVFGEWNAEKFHSTFKSHNGFHLLTGWVDGQMVAFKLGYELGNQEFYSWLGGVLPEYRGLGIASELMKRQHAWCFKNGFTKIQTKTKNRFREMLLLNIKSGFQIIGYQSSEAQDSKILMEKNLRS